MDEPGAMRLADRVIGRPCVCVKGFRFELVNGSKISSPAAALVKTNARTQLTRVVLRVINFGLQTWLRSDKA